MYFLSSHIKNIEPEFKVPFPVATEGKSVTRPCNDSLKYELIKKFSNLIDYQSTSLTSEEMECYYNEYSAKVVSRVLEMKAMQENRGQCGSVCDGGENCGSVSNFSDLRWNNRGPLTATQRGTKRLAGRVNKQPTTIQEDLNESIESRSGNTHSELQEMERIDEVSPIKRNLNRKGKTPAVSKRLRNKENQIHPLVAYSNNSSSSVFATPVITSAVASKEMTNANKQAKNRCVTQRDNRIRNQRNRFNANAQHSEDEIDSNGFDFYN